MSEPTCEQRIAGHMESREEDFTKLFAIVDGDSEDNEYDDEQLTDEEAYDRLAEMPLAVELRRYVRIDLSTGGPGDWLEADLDEDGEVTRVEYHFNDWFDHAARPVYKGDSLYRAAEYYAAYVEDSQ